jgi:tagaturonate reductase
MKLSRKNIEAIALQECLTKPAEKLFELPEKVLQFGTGVLLRGLPDYFIDKANRQDIFNGRILMVKSTSNGATDEFSKQDGLYTLCIRGIENGEKIEEYIINSSISRVLSANENWDSILEAASNPEMQVVISNTTEIGITLVQDDIRLYPPLSFPGKLLAFLYTRYKAFSGDPSRGMVIIPTELITGNGEKLKSILNELSKMNRLETGFIEWLNTSNYFCNSLVDRIVPGKLTGNDLSNTQEKLGYEDDLMIMAESFRLWAVESNDDHVKEILSFSKADPSFIIAPDIEKFRELKLRLLNGTHTFSCGLAHLAGFSTVREAMQSEGMSSYLRNRLAKEITGIVACETISFDEAAAFAETTLERFSNPFLDHSWLSICLQYSTKMKLRNVPLLVKHYSKTTAAPEAMSLGFAAFLLFMKPVREVNGIFEGFANGKTYPIQDAEAGYFASQWESSGKENIVSEVLKDTRLWGEDLSLLPGFSKSVHENLQVLIQQGAMTTIRNLELNKTIA